MEHVPAGVMRGRDHFGGSLPSWNRPGMQITGGNWEMPVKAGEVIEARVGPAPR